MTLMRITDRFYITGQIMPADMPALAAQGFVAVINNRPDNEAPDQPGHEMNAAAAAAAGLGYLYLPVTAAMMDGAVADRFRLAVDALPGPVLAHCRSGMRSFTLWAIAEVLAGKMTAQEVSALALGRGCDASDALNWLALNTDARP